MGRQHDADEGSGRRPDGERQGRVGARRSDGAGVQTGVSRAHRGSRFPLRFRRRRARVRAAAAADRRSGLSRRRHQAAVPVRALRRAQGRGDRTRASGDGGPAGNEVGRLRSFARRGAGGPRRARRTADGCRTGPHRHDASEGGRPVRARVARHQDLRDARRRRTRGPDPGERAAAPEGHEVGRHRRRQSLPVRPLRPSTARRHRLHQPRRAAGTHACRAARDTRRRRAAAPGQPS